MELVLLGLLCLIVLLAWKSYNDILIIKQYQQERRDQKEKEHNSNSSNSSNSSSKSGMPMFCSELSGHCEVYPWWRYAHWVHPGWGYKFYNPMFGWHTW